MVSKSFYVRNGLVVGAASVDATTGNITTTGTLSASTATFTGAVTAPTPATLDNSTKLATTAFVQSAVAAVSGASTAGTITYNPIQVATAGQTVFTVPSGYASNLIMVYVNGYKLPPSDYTAVNGNSITLKVGSNVNDELETVVFSAQVMGATSSIQRTSVIATSLQTVFSVTYPVGMILVKVNGLIIPSSDYTASNGTSVVLATGVPVNTEMEFLVFTAMNLVNAVPSTGGSMTGALSVNGDVSMTSQNGGQLAGLRNKIINGNFDIWQRGTSFNNPTALYIADRWSIDVDNTSASWTIAKATALQDVADQGTTGILRFAVSTVGSMTFADIGQKIENVGTLQNQIATISCYHRFGTTAKSIYMYIEQGFGTGGSASVQTQVIPLQTGSTLTGFTKLSGTITVPSIAGKTIGSNSYLRVVIRIFTPSANDYCDITKVQVESGGASTPFETRPIGLEYALCQRYYETTGGGTTSESASFVPTRADFAALNMRYQVTKRAVPTVTIYSASSGVAGTVRQIDGTGSPANITATVSSTVSEIVNVVGTFQVGTHYGFNFTSSAEL